MENNIYKSIYGFISTSIYLADEGFNGYDEAAKKIEKLFTVEIYKESILSRIEENQSILEMAKLHMDERAVLVINDRIKELKKEL